MDDVAKGLIEKYKKLEVDRSTWENHWADLAPLVLPRQDDFFNENTVGGDKRTRQRFDDTATLALERGSAAIEGVLIPRGQMWHGISPPDELVGDYEVEAWCERLAAFLFNKRYDSKANFASQAHEFIMSLLAFGTAIMSVEDIVGEGIRYKTCHLSEHYVMENSRGFIDTTYRCYKLTAKQAMEKFGEEAGDKVKQKFEKAPNEKMEFLHVVMPDRNGDADGMPFVSYHISVQDGKLMATGGFKTFPYIISRWVTAPNETYGRSPAMTVLAEIKMLNQIRKTDLKQRHMAVDPPILAADQHTIRKLSMKAGAINYGTLDMNGNPLVRPYNAGTNISISNDIIEQSRQIINDAFFVNLFQILVETPQMTATEVLYRAEEKGQLLSPSAGRQMTEWLDPLVEREISLYEEYGIFEDDGILAMPDKLKEFGGAINVRYTNPLSQMQKSGKGAATERTLQSLLPYAEAGSLEKVDWSGYADIIREANGAPVTMFKSDEQLEAERQAQAQQQAMMQMVEAAPQVAGAVKDVAQAQALSEG